MTVQMHVAYSSVFRGGAGVVGGGPYYCAYGNAITAQHACMTTPSLVNVPALVQITRNTELTRTIDKLSNLKDARVFLFSGASDTVVDPGVVKKLETYYGHFTAAANVKGVYDVNAEHAMITTDYGNACAFKGDPYINNCAYDLAGTLLQHLFRGELTPPSTANGTASGIQSFDQSKFLPLGSTLNSAGLGKTGYVYVPAKCAGGASVCHLHLALHGCHQFAGAVGMRYVEHAGYNRWAEMNGIVVLYPQTTASSTVPLNPNGCFDWWGFTGTAYASKLGPQMATIMHMVTALSGAHSEPLPADDALGGTFEDVTVKWSWDPNTGGNCTKDSGAATIAPSSGLGDEVATCKIGDSFPIVLTLYCEVSHGTGGTTLTAHYSEASQSPRQDAGEPVTAGCSTVIFGGQPDRTEGRCCFE
jgi:hypothetical protein